MRQSLPSLLFRLTFAGGCFGFAFWAATYGYRNLHLTLMVSSVPVFVLGVLVIWSPLFKFLTKPLIAMVDSLFFPGGKLDKPTLNFKLPTYLVNEGRYTEALGEYEKILKHYPDEVEAYEKAIWLQEDIFEEHEKARRLVKRAQRRHLALDERFQRLVESREELSTQDRKSD